MSTHNIGFYEETTKIIFQLPPQIIKYAPYHLFCKYCVPECHILSVKGWAQSVLYHVNEPCEKNGLSD